MTLRPYLTPLCLALALVSGASWAASGKTTEDTAPATPGMGAPAGTDVPGAADSGNAPVTNPTGANGALDMRHVDPANAPTGKHDQHTAPHTQPNDSSKAPAKP
jgi:hypothetical protein